MSVQEENTRNSVCTVGIHVMCVQGGNTCYNGCRVGYT